MGNSRTVPGEDPYLGLVIGEQVELRQLIGIGSMGRVYRAFQRGVERDVAVKVLHRELSANLTLVTRFLREAKISSRLTHPNVVQVLMTGQLGTASNAAAVGGELYIVMEYLDGISLMSALAAAGGVMPLARALHVALQICDAVGEAHAQGIVHRDIKPENVMLVRRGDDPDYVKVLDFGIARLDWGEESFATQAGLIFGTARYISPEGSQGKPVSPSADVYAIATILYQCLSGRTPFDADSSVGLLMQHAYETPPALLDIPRASYVPPQLATVIMRNLSKSPEERCQDARIFGRELVEAARAGGLSADDLIPRSTLLGQRGVLTSFASIQRTKQMQLSAETAAAIHSSAAADSATDHESDRSKQNDTASEEPSLAAPSPGPPTRDNDDGSSWNEPMEAMRNDGDSIPTRSFDRRRIGVFIVFCILAGAILTLVGAARLGRWGKLEESYVERANRAMSNQQWDAPPGQNVKDITDEGLVLHPGDEALQQVRRRAADELIKSALGRKYAGDLEGALRHAKLARDFAPESTTAQHLVRELEGLSMDAGVTTPEREPSGQGNETKKSVPPVGSSHRAIPLPSSPAASSSGAWEPSHADSAGSSSVPAPSSTGGRWL